MGSPNITKGSPRSGLGRPIMPSSAGSGMPEPLKPKHTVAGVAFPEGTKVTKGKPVRVSRPSPGSFGDREARSTFDVHELDKDDAANDPRPKRRKGSGLPSPESPKPPYTGPVSEPTEKERWEEAHRRVKQTRNEAETDYARVRATRKGREAAFRIGSQTETGSTYSDPKRSVPSSATGARPGDFPGPSAKAASTIIDIEQLAKRKSTRDAKRAVAARRRRVTARGREEGRKGRVHVFGPKTEAASKQTFRPAGRIETTGDIPKDSPKGAREFKGIVSREGLGRVATPEAAWHRTFGAVAPFSGRYPNQPATIARMPKVRPKTKASWSGRAGAASIFAEPLAFAVAGGIKNKSFGGVLDGLKAWKEKYMPSKPSGPLL